MHDSRFREGSAKQRQQPSPGLGSMKARGRSLLNPQWIEVTVTELSWGETEGLP